MSGPVVRRSSLLLVLCLGACSGPPPPPVTPVATGSSTPQATARPSPSPTPVPLVDVVGVVRGPAGVQAAGAMDLAAVGILAAGKQPRASFAVAALPLSALSGAQVQAFDGANRPVGDPVLTGADGRFRLPGLPRGGGAFVVRAGVRTAAGLTALETLVRPAEGVEVAVDPATTAVTAMVLLKLGLSLAALRQPAFDRAALAVRRALGPGAVESLRTPAALVEQVTGIAAADEDLRLALQELALPPPTPVPDPDVALTAPFPPITSLPSPTPTPTPRPIWSPWALRTPIPLVGLAGLTRLRPFAGGDVAGWIDGAGELARFAGPRGLAFGPDGTLHVADTENHVIRRVDGTGRVQTLVGAGQPGPAEPLAYDEARFDTPTDLVVLDAETVLVADAGNHVLRRIRHEDGAAVEVRVFSGDGEAGFFEGPAGEARYERPEVLAFDGRRTVFVVDGTRILAVDALTGAMNAHAGSEVPGVLDGPASQARFRTPSGLAVRWRGEVREVWVADEAAGNVRRIVEDPAQPEALVETVLGPSEPGAQGSDPRVYGWQDGSDLSRVRFRGPGRLAFSPAGDLFVADGGNAHVRWLRFAGEAPAEVRTLGVGSVSTGGITAPFVLPGLAAVAVHPTLASVWVLQRSRPRLGVFE